MSANASGEYAVVAALGRNKRGFVGKRLVGRDVENGSFNRGSLAIYKA